MKKENSLIFIFFGATGDLAKRKLYPALYQLFSKGILQDHFGVLGTSFVEMDDSQFQKMVIESVLRDDDTDKQAVTRFASHFRYIIHDLTDQEHYAAVKARIEDLDEQYVAKGNRIFYLSVAPSFFGTTALYLKSEQLLSENGINRLIIEKPFGRNYDSAKELNDALTATFAEEQIFRIDHYLGKEMIQNIQAIRFGNPIVESLWNNRYIDNVQVTLSEKLGVEERASYYDHSGALRDMIQNHTMQIISQLVMEQPVAFDDEDVRIEKIKALRTVRVYQPAEAKANFVRGQYGAGNGSVAYRDEDGVDPDSTTETFVAGKLLFDNYRWSGVPFYVRTGKKLVDKFTRIDVTFKRPLVDIFSASSDKEGSLAENILTIFVEPEQGFSLKVNAKNSNPQFTTEPINLDFIQNQTKKEDVPEPYELLIHDVINGNGTNFASWEEVAYAWRFADVIRNCWDAKKPDFPNYEPNSMGPAAADELLKRDGRKWLY